MNPASVPPNHPPTHEPFLMAVGHLMRQTLTVGAEDSLERAISELRRNGGFIPIIESGVLCGQLTEEMLRSELLLDANLTISAGSVAQPAPKISPYSTGSEALRRFDSERVDRLIVVDDHGRVMGQIRPSDLYPKKRILPRPALVGGMATPFGVYLTTGAIRGGASLLAVVSTGTLMFTMLACSNVIGTFATQPLAHSQLPGFLKDSIPAVLILCLFGLIMRLIPLSGTHAAEHMVVHAMERGEELVPEVVARMPRVHPRCGTNIAVGMTLFLSIYGIEWIKYDDIRFLTAAIVTLFSWRPLGSLVQYYITTKKPTEAQIRSGIKAGNELMSRFATAKSTQASIPVRIWNSGLLQVVMGSSLMLLLLKGVMLLFHFSIPGLE